jgi:hypothetical protein
MARGGKRPGAGRKAGDTNKHSRQAAVAVKASGKPLPHEWLLGVMFAEAEIEDYVCTKSGSVVVDEDGKPLLVKRKPTFAERVDAAKAAASFYAPKLAATAAIPPEVENPIEALMEQVQASATNRARPGK